MNWVVAILITAPIAVLLCRLITKAAEWAFLTWPDILRESRAVVNVKKGIVIVAGLLALSVLVEAGGLLMVWLVNHL